MGKGSRNREFRVQDKIENPKKYQKRKQMPKWIMPAIALVVLVAIIVGVVASVISREGVIQRSNILIKSQTGKFDVTQQMATYFAWQEAYYNGYYYYYYVSNGYISDSNNVTAQFGSADAYALAVAQATVQNSLRDSVDALTESLVQYVALADAAWNAGVRLDADDRADVDSTITWLKSLQTGYSYASLGAFLRAAVCNGMKEKDITAAMELAALASKYSASRSEEFSDGVTDAELDAFRIANPSSFYKTDYLTYSTTDASLKDVLAAAADAVSFKKAVVESIFNKNYKSCFNEIVASVESAEALAALTGKTGTELTAALDTLGATEKTYKSDDSFNNNDLKNWLFGTRAVGDSTKVTDGTSTLVLAVVEEPTSAENIVTVKVREKSFAVGTEEGDTFEGDSAFRSEMLKDIERKLELDETALSTKYSADGTAKADKVYFALLADLTEEIGDSVPAEKTEPYAAEPAEGSYQEWLFKNTDTTTFASVVAEGATKVIEKSETKDEVTTTTYSVYLVVNTPMYLDETVTADGGYLLFANETTGDAPKTGKELADAAVASFAGKTGADLTAALTAANSSATVSKTISTSSLDESLKTWFNDPARAANDYAVVEKADGTGAFIAVYLDGETTWKFNARAGVASEKVEKMVDELTASYSVNEKGLAKLGAATPTTETAAAN